MSNSTAFYNVSASKYDEQRRKILPFFDDFYKAAVNATSFGERESNNILDLGAGTGLLSAWILSAHPQANITLADESEKMLVGAKDRLYGQNNVRFETCDFSKNIPLGSFDTVASSLAIHHLDAQEKQVLFSRIYDALQPGGMFVNADQIKGETDKIQTQYHESWKKAAEENGATVDDIASTEERMRALDKPSTVKEQLTWLEEAGFVNVNCLYQNGQFAVLNGMRP